MLKAGLFIIEMCFSILKSNIEAYMTYLVDFRIIRND